MTIKFYGTFQELSKIVESSGYRGAWSPDAPEGKPTFRFNNGAVLNWWASSGSLQFQGKLEPREEVIAVIVPMLFKKP